MKLGINFFFTGHTIDVATLAQASEKLGFDALFVSDHTVMPDDPTLSYREHGPIPAVLGELADPFVSLGMAAAVTRHITLGTGICLVPERHPLTMAKAVATLDNFSHGRVMLGVGVGWLKEETEAYGLAFSDRWTYMDESVRAMKALWRDGVASSEGRFVNFPRVRCEPLPASRPGPPVLLGAPATPIQCRRIAQQYDGWIANGAGPGAIARGRETILREYEAIGRDPSQMKVVAMGFDLSPETLRAYEAAGADMVVVALYNHPGTPMPLAGRMQQHQAMVYAPTPTPEQTLGALEKLAKLAGLQ
jgi:probable F420-dependent oxidoreductase